MTMPPELRKAHQASDAAVLAAYGFSSMATASEIVSKLFEMYAKLTGEEEWIEQSLRRQLSSSRTRHEVPAAGEDPCDGW